MLCKLKLIAFIHCMKLNESKHASHDQSQFKMKQANWSKSHVIHGWNQIECKRTFKWSCEFESNFASWSSLHETKVRISMHSWIKQVESKHASKWLSQFEFNFACWSSLHDSLMKSSWKRTCIHEWSQFESKFACWS